MTEGPEAKLEALNVAFFTMAEMLHRDELLDQSELASLLERFHNEEEPAVMANLHAMGATLRARPLQGKGLQVIEGGLGEQSKRDESEHSDD